MATSNGKDPETANRNQGIKNMAIDAFRSMNQV